MGASAPTRIHLLGSGRHEEIKAAGAITPGHLVAMNSDGEAIVHGTAGGWAEKIFALEDALQGRIITDAYADDELVACVVASPGDVVYAFLAEGESADPSEFLTSNGDGTLKVASGTDIRIAVPLETVDNSETGDSGAARIKVRVI